MEATFFIEHDVYVVPADDRVFIYAGGKGRDIIHKHSDNPPHSDWQPIPEEMRRTIPFPADWKAAVLPLNYARKRMFSDFWLRFGSAFIRQTSGDRKPPVWLPLTCH